MSGVISRPQGSGKRDPSAKSGIISDAHLTTHVEGSVGSQPYQIEYLVVGGGGSGQSTVYPDGGAGGAGGYRTNVPSHTSGGNSQAEGPMLVHPGKQYQIIVGAGTSSQGQRGNNSRFANIISEGGASAGSHRGAGRPGGSGGGAGGEYVGPDNARGGFGKKGQGYPGGHKSSYPGGGGGGGAGAAGQGGSGTSLDGGVGIQSDINNASTWRGGGGGGNTSGSGGNGGGGAGQGNGSVNTGGGGGGGQTPSSTGGTGGSGYVCVRYFSDEVPGIVTGRPSTWLPQPAGGTVIHDSNISGYRIHQFTSSGIFTA